MAQTRFVLKLVAIAALTLIILIALWIVDNVISDRQNYRNQAVKSVAESYAGEQRLVGPLLVQPFRRVTEEVATDSKGVERRTSHTADFTAITYPSQLNLTGVLTPSVRRHGLYHAIVYELSAHLTGQFQKAPLSAKGQVTLGLPYLAWTVADARGIVGRPVLQVNGESVELQGALFTEAEQDNGIHPDLVNGTNLRGLLPAASSKPGNVAFALDLTLAGTQSLAVVPLASTNRFELSSSWREPLFAGQFLPRTREVNKGGFQAVWELSSLASASQQQMLAGSKYVDAISVSLTNLVDPYTVADRAVNMAFSSCC